MDVPSYASDRGLGRSHSTLPKIHIPGRNSERASKTLSKPDSSTEAKPDSEIDPKSHRKTDPNLESDKARESKSYHKPHLHRRHHRHHHNARETIQSAVQLPNPFSFESYNPLRRRSHNHHSYQRESTHPSRRESQRTSDSYTQQQQQQHQQQDQTQQQQQQEQQHQADSETQSQDIIKPLKKVIRPEHVQQERKRREQRTEDVSAALNALSRDAHTATRKLDDTYYALLERVAILKSTLSSLHHLSSQANDARTEWQENFRATGAEIEDKISGFAAFETQTKDVDEMVSRLKEGKDKASLLEERLEGCRGRLEQIQRNDERERQVVNKRWRMFWGILATVLLLVVLLLVWRQKRGKPDLLHELRSKGVELAAEVGVVDRHTSPTVNKTKVGLRLVDDQYEKQRSQKGEKWDRLLDEL